MSAAIRSEISDVGIESLARGFCREAEVYGFGQIEYVKFVNAVLDQSLRNASCPCSRQNAPPPRSEPAAPAASRLGRKLPLTGRRVVVRALEPATDLPLLTRWLADELGRVFLLSRVTAKHADIETLVFGQANTFGVITLHDATPIGAVAFLDHDTDQRKAEMRKLIGEPTHRERGLAKEASALWIRYGLEGLGLKKIYVSTFHTSVRNVRLNQELGFRLEGILRNEVFLDGTYHDVLRMALWSDGSGGPPEDGAEERRG